MSDSAPHPESCGCCGGGAAPARRTANRPGMAEIAYRVGTHGSFKAAMLAALARGPGLRALSTRDDDDPAIALLDGWATLLDVLSFYQERIANEGFLRTATERRSILEMARSIGYELRPGVAASTFLAFTLETAAGAPPKAKIGVGTKAQSVPHQDEKPQTFETVEAIEGRGAWNELRPQTRRLVAPYFGQTSLYLAGIATDLKPGDGLLLVGDERKNYAGSENWDFRRVLEVEAVTALDPAVSHTVVRLERGLGSITPHVEPAKQNPRVYALRQRASLFGHNAQPWATLPISLRVGERAPDGTLHTGPFASRQNSWADAPFAAGTQQVHLDNVYPRVVADSWVVLASADYEELYKVTAVAERTKADFLLSGRTTRLTLSGENIEQFSPQNATVFAQSEPLAMAPEPILDPVAGDALVLDRLVEGLTPGRLIAVSGLDAASGKAASEVATLKQAVPDGSGATRLELAAALSRSYVRASVTVNANVARATHGETRGEILGGGNGSRPFQRFELKQRPLTYVAAPTPSGSESTLEVRVDGVLWDEAPSLYEAAPSDRVYVTRTAEDGRVAVQFGDGIHGARLPTGSENVAAAYRIGTGLAGQVEAGQISLLLSRPLGLQGVVNPVAPEGAGDPETPDRARRNAPLTVLTLDRVVSLQDHEDFARAFAGIAKAQAALLWDGESRVVHLTVAAPAGGAVGGLLAANLLAAVDRARHADQKVRLDSYQALPFRVEARLRIDRRYLPAAVLSAARRALLAAFSFEERAFGQAVTASEVASILQGIEGVVAVFLDRLYLAGQPPSAQQRLVAAGARFAGGAVLPAQLLTLDPTGLELAEMVP